MGRDIVCGLPGESLSWRSTCAFGNSRSSPIRKNLTVTCKLKLPAEHRYLDIIDLQRDSCAVDLLLQMRCSRGCSQRMTRGAPASPAVMHITSRLHAHCDTHAMDMWRFPELIIGHEDDGTPSEAVCSMCGKRIREAEPPIPGAKVAITAFSMAFQL